MSDSKSVTAWIDDLKEGNEEAAARLWERYFERMVQAAKNKLRRHRLAVTEGEDVALSAFDSLCRGAANGNFGQLTDRRDLWPLLLTITAQKSIDRVRWESRQRRGGGKVLRECELPTNIQGGLIDQILAQGPTPEFLLLMDEQYTRLLGQLRNETLRGIVKWKLEGHTNERIGEFLGISVHSVGRKLRMIRLAWSHELDQ